MTVSVIALTNALSNHINHIRITYNKGCLIIFYIPSHTTYPGKAARKLSYILSNERHTGKSMYKD